MELILRGAANMSKGVITNEHLTLPPSRAFIDDITILISSKIAADGLLQRYYDFFRWSRMTAKPKKSWSLSFVGGFVREIHFKIWCDTIPTVREKPVKSLGRLYSIPLTDRRWGMEVQKEALNGLKSINWDAYRWMRLCYLALSGFNSITTNTSVSGLKFLFVFRK